MEKEQCAKKSKTPLFVIALAVLLIAAGVVLILTGNNKSFWEKNEPNKTEEKDEEPKEDDTPNRGRQFGVISDEEAFELIKGYNETMTPEFTDEIQTVEVIGADKNKEKFLVNYEVIGEDGTVTEKQTIISSLDGDVWVDWPGWNAGERDLTVYDFTLFDSDHFQTELPNFDNYQYVEPSEEINE